MNFEEDRMGNHFFPVGNDWFPQSSIVNDPIFDAFTFIGPHLPFHEDFMGDYKSIYNKAPHKLYDMK